jgi:hypothetical protein
MHPLLVEDGAYRYARIRGRQAIRQPRIEVNLPAWPLFRLQRIKTCHGNYSAKQKHL